MMNIQATNAAVKKAANNAVKNAVHEYIPDSAMVRIQNEAKALGDDAVKIVHDYMSVKPVAPAESKMHQPGDFMDFFA